VGNRGIWLSAGGLSPQNSVSGDLLANLDFAIGNLTDRTLLRQQTQLLTASQKSQLAAKGVSPLPYDGFPNGQTVRQVILPFPQYRGITPASAPIGQSSYDGLQLVVTQRLSHGLSMNANYTFAKTLDAIGSTDPFNRDLAKDLAGSDLPHQFRLSVDYKVPTMRNGLLGNRLLSYVLSDWGVGWYLQYQSAPTLARPANVTGSANAVNKQSATGAVYCPYAQGCNNPISDWLGYGPGSAQLRTDADGNPMSPWAVNWTDLNGNVHPEPIDINCHCFDPTKTDVLNRDAWVSVPTAEFAADQSTIRWFRGIRAPQENANISRTFRIKERVSFQIRAEFSNVFNRLTLPNPVLNGTGINFTSATSSSNGLLSGGFGTFGNISVNGAGSPRTGVLIGRLQF
jgi:hypothetical protein